MANDNSKIYWEERKHLVDCIYKTSNLYDQSILTLSSGALGLSITFIKQITQNIKAPTILILIIAWIFLVLAIIITLISFKTSEQACFEELKIVENYVLKNKTDKIYNKWSKWTFGLNIASGFFFILGMIMWARFTIINLN